VRSGLRPHAILFWLGAFGSIACLLGQCYAVGSMRGLALAVWAPATAVMAAAAWSGARRGDADLLLRIRAGLLGGLWGTMGYDLVRIPFHLAGLNPFVPIRAYGVWLAGAAHSTPWTDALGFAYHLSNGVTFGWILSVPALRRHWAWAVLWALGLETLAVLTPFADVFGLRGQYGALWLAYAAHVLYGVPLGIACREPERHVAAAWPPGRTARGRGTVALVVLVGAWFLAAWQPLGRQPSLAPGEVILGPDGAYPGWTELDRGRPFRLVNRTPERLEVRVRRPGAWRTPGEAVWLEPGQAFTARADLRGLHQILVAGRPWRSVLVAVREGSDYRPER
jgi:hypothetical protein